MLTRCQKLMPLSALFPDQLPQCVQTCKAGTHSKWQPKCIME
jgi:hypothetical protein